MQLHMEVKLAMGSPDRDSSWYCQCDGDPGEETGTALQNICNQLFWGCFIFDFLILKP